MPATDLDWIEQSQLKKRKPRHGFKAHAKRAGLALRVEHGWAADSRIDCFELAAAMDVTVLGLSDLDACDAVHQLLRVDPNCFSAATLHSEDGIAVLLNDGHAPERQASNLAHEIGHVALTHEGAPVLSDSGCREHDAEVEIEANYFGSVLLVPDAAVLRLARAGLTIAQAADELGVSTQMMQWRYNDSGAAKRLAGRRR